MPPEKPKKNQKTLPLILQAILSQVKVIPTDNPTQFVLLAASDKEAAFLSSPHIMSILYPYYKNKHSSLVSLFVIFSPSLSFVSSGFADLVSFK